jgi:integrase
VRVLKRHAVRAGVAVIPAAGKQWDAVDGMTSRLSPHALRRAWATHSLNDPTNPVPIEVVSMVLGHADTGTTRKFYAQTDDGRGRCAARAVGAAP